MKSSLLDSIVSILREHTPKTPIEELWKDKFLQHAHIDMLSKQNTHPGHFTASGFVRNRNTQQVVLIFHPKFHKWIQPGGHLEVFDEHIVEAAKREIMEETGLVELEWDGTMRLDIHDVPASSSVGAHQHWDLQLGFGTEQTNTSGTLAAQWFFPHELNPSMTDDSVMRFVEGWL